jgi:polyhydroxyalkanoate synthase
MSKTHSADFQKFISDMQNAGQKWVHSLGGAPIPANAAELQAAWLKAIGAISAMTPATGEADGLAAMQANWKAEQQKLMAQFSHGAGQSAHDKRFQSADWQTAAQFRLLADAYLATSLSLLQSLDAIDMEPGQKKRARFFLKQYLDAIAPSNFLATNPEALKLALDTKGESLRLGAENFTGDLAKGHVSITDETAFEVGKDIAVSPGKVIFENDLFQLIQYQPSTSQVYLRPMLFVPPCINKFYILDLTPENSLIRYLVSEGHTVFVMSWRNVDASLGSLTWDDYIATGVVKAIDVVRLVTNVEKINTLGFCVGGTLLACALAVLRRMGHDVVESVTFLTTFVDFTDVGDIDAYIDEAFVATREREVGQGGVVKGSDLAFAFSSLRANDLIWSYVISNYLKGSKPPAFDLLYWNADSTNLPGPWYCWYVRNTYLENNLVKPDRVRVCDVPIDMSYIDMPAFVFAAKEDHIVPWRSAYASAVSFGGDVEFTLGASGHIAGVVNPASKNKRSYWQQKSSSAAIEGSGDQWLASAEEVPGSWWVKWVAWLVPHGGRKISARNTLGNANFPPMENAPGRYVRAKMDEQH